MSTVSSSTVGRDQIVTTTADFANRNTSIDATEIDALYRAVQLRAQQLLQSSTLTCFFFSSKDELAEEEKFYQSRQQRYNFELPMCLYYAIEDLKTNQFSSFQQPLGEFIENRIYYHLEVLHRNKGESLFVGYGKMKFYDFSSESNATNEEKMEAINRVRIELPLACIGNDRSPTNIEANVRELGDLGCEQEYQQRLEECLSQVCEENKHPQNQKDFSVCIVPIPFKVEAARRLRRELKREWGLTA